MGAIFDQLYLMNFSGVRRYPVGTFLNPPELIIFAKMGLTPIRPAWSIGIVGNMVAAKRSIIVMAESPISLRQGRIENVFSIQALGRKENDAQACFWIQVLHLPYSDEVVREIFRTPEDMVVLFLG